MSTSDIAVLGSLVFLAIGTVLWCAHGGDVWHPSIIMGWSLFLGGVGPALVRSLAILTGTSVFLDRIFDFGYFWPTFTLTSLSIVSFAVGALAGERSRFVRLPWVDTQSIRTPAVPLVIADVAVLFLALNYDVSGSYAVASYTSSTAEFLSRFATLIYPVLMLYVSTTSSNRRSKALLWVSILVTVFFGAQTGGRRVPITVLAGLMAVWSAQRRRIHRITNSLRFTVAIALLAMVILSYGRSYGLGAVSIVENGIASASQRGPLTLVLELIRSFGSPGVTTQIVRLVPHEQSWWLGTSYLGTAANWLFPTSVTGLRMFENPSLWFQRIYPSPGQGYDFNGIAEAYLNFGYIGPILVFGALGFAIGILYRRSVSFPLGLDPAVYGLSMMQMLWYLRTDSENAFGALGYYLVALGVLYVWCSRGRVHLRRTGGSR